MITTVVADAELTDEASDVVLLLEDDGMDTASSSAQAARLIQAQNAITRTGECFIFVSNRLSHPASIAFNPG
jgi:hypothetical protein